MVLVLLLPDVMQAAGTEPIISPAQATLDDGVIIEETLLAQHDSPTAGIAIHFFIPARFTYVTSKMLLGESATDHVEVAVLGYQLWPR